MNFWGFTFLGLSHDPSVFLCLEIKGLVSKFNFYLPIIVCCRVSSYFFVDLKSFSFLTVVDGGR